MTTTAAAQRLGVSTRQAQRLVADGVLTRAAGNVVTAESVARARAQRNANAHQTRAWSEQTAWAALALLSGRDDLACGIGQAQVSRLRARLRDATPESLASSLRERAQVCRFDAHSSAVQRAREQVIETCLGKYDDGLTPRSSAVVDGYVDPDTATTMTSALALHPAVGAANMVLRLTRYPHVAEVACGGAATTGADLAESVNPRERSEGLRLLADALARFAR